MNLSDKEFERFVRKAKKVGANLETDKEYRRLYRDSYALVDMTSNIWKFQKSLDRRLRRNPDGFAFPAEGRPCRHG